MVINPTIGIYILYNLYTLWLFNIAMENGPFIDGLPIKNDDFPWLCQITRWYILYNLYNLYNLYTCQL